MENQKAQYEKEFDKYFHIAAVLLIFSLLVLGLVFLLVNSDVEDPITPPVMDTIIIEEDQPSPANPKQNEQKHEGSPPTSPQQ